MSQEQGKWIAVKEKRPPSGKDVLAVGYQNEMLIGGVYKDDGDWICECEGVQLTNVTHWMLLPPLPREQQAAAWSALNSVYQELLARNLATGEIRKIFHEKMNALTDKKTDK